METGRRSGRRGQPATEIVINPDGGYSVGVNIDRDHLTVVLIDLAGKVRGKKHVEWNFPLPDETFTWIEAAYDELLRGNGLSKEDLSGIGLAIPFKLGYRRLSQTPESFAVWRDYPACQRLEKIVGSTVYEENDATASAIGEAQYGHGIFIHSFFYLFIGYGLGGGLVIDGDYVHGYNGHSGEIGHIPIAAATVTGRPVNLQDKVSLSTLYARFGELGIKVSSPKGLIALHDSHQSEIREWLNESAEYLLPHLIAMNCIVNPGAILIGGRLPDSFTKILIDALEKRIDPIRRELPSVPQILGAKCSVDSAALGAAIVPFARILFPAQDALMKKPDNRQSTPQQTISNHATTKLQAFGARLETP